MNTKKPTILWIGIALLVITIGLRFTLVRDGNPNQTPDFVLGVLFGVGLGLATLFFVRRRQSRKDT